MAIGRNVAVIVHNSTQIFIYLVLQGLGMARRYNTKIFNQKKAIFEINLRTLYYVLAALFTIGIAGFIILKAINTILK